MPIRWAVPLSSSLSPPSPPSPSSDFLSSSPSSETCVGSLSSTHRINNLEVFAFPALLQSYCLHREQFACEWLRSPLVIWSMAPGLSQSPHFHSASLHQAPFTCKLLLNFSRLTAHRWVHTADCYLLRTCMANSPQHEDWHNLCSLLELLRKNHYIEALVT